MTEPIVETPAPGVALVRLNRPEALNALNMGPSAATSPRPSPA